MAASSPSSKVCKHDSTLFRDGSGNPIIFVLRPSKERQKITPLIKHGGGEIKASEKEGVKCIRLAEPGSCIGGGKYISTKYITDCCEANKLLNPDKYSLNSFDSDLEHAAVIQRNPAVDCKGRKKYTLEEDLAIISTLISSYRENDATGICIWQAMEREKITGHSYQSMRTRYLKQILPNIDSYSIEPYHKARLTGNPYKAKEPATPTLQSNQSNLSGLRSPQVNPKANISSTQSHSSPLKDKVANIENNPRSSPAKKVQLSPTKEPVSASVSEKNTPSRQTEASKNSPVKQQTPIASSTPKKNNNSKTTPSKKTPEESTIQEETNDTTSSNKESSSSDESISDDELDKQLYELTEKSPSIKNGTRKKSKPRKEDRSSAEEVSFHDSSQEIPKLRSTAKVRKLDFVTTNTKNDAVPKKTTKKYVADSTTNTDVNGNNRSETRSEKIKTNTRTKGSRKDFASFVMDERSPTETEGSDGEENSSDSDLEDLNEVIEMLRRKYNLSRDECLQVLWRNCGSVNDAIHWIEYGTDMSGRPGWTKADDKILGNSTDLQSLTHKFSLKEIHKRSLFLEDVNK